MNVHWLMDRIDEYKRVEEDREQGKEKAKVIPQDKRALKGFCLAIWVYGSSGG